MAPALLLLFLSQSVHLLSDKRKVVTKGREVSSAEIQAQEDPLSLSLSQARPKHIYFLMCYPAPFQKRLILQAE